MFVRLYWPCEISWKWAREGYKPGTYHEHEKPSSSDASVGTS